MATPKLNTAAKSSGANKALIQSVKDEAGVTHSEAVEAINAYCLNGHAAGDPIDPTKVAAHLKDGPEKPSEKASGFVAQAREAAGATAPKNGFDIQAYMAQMKETAEGMLVKAGRYNATIDDARVGSDANDSGLFYGVLDVKLEGVPEGVEPIPLFAAVNTDDSLKTADGELDTEKFRENPHIARQFLAGLATVDKLIKIAGIDADELADVADADDLLQSFIGTELCVVVARSKDQYGLPANKIKKIVGPKK
ncbi:hypothetical protein GS636_21495 [Ruegeria sp. HKCCD4884]|uniref:hypothetical protein n=1 Tax=Ruegeria sp. HKCCD4884 TaxID=2683022 RepID=UPI0014928C80|nr:hypothetical protein [Ruegeria sp. HKCCD4884]NOD95381.1 hypothetical protein [Ruegeria sp. HKCCD4884]